MPPALCRFALDQVSGVIPVVFNEPTAKTGYFCISPKGLVPFKKAPEARLFSGRYRLNEASVAACIQIVVQLTGPRSGVDHGLGRSGLRPTARRPAEH